MISSLKLQNIALIERAEIDFYNGLNVMSGETGAGKTVIIGAINFVLGAKADKNMIRYGKDFCEAEIVFENVDSLSIKEICENIGVDYDSTIIIKRKFFSDGRGFIKVNGTTVNLTMLKSLTSNLCDIYGQSEHYSLLNKANQLKVLDNFCGEEILKVKDELKPVISTIKQLNKSLELGGGDARQRAYKADLLKFQINEIESANLIDGEEEELLAKRKVLQNIEKIGTCLQAVKSSLSDDNCAVDLINYSTSNMSQIADINEDYSNIYDRLYSLKAEADDISSEVENMLDGLEFDGEESARVEERLEIIRTLKRKYGASVSEIESYLEGIKNEYDLLVEFEENSIKINAELEKNYKILQGLYNKITEIRTKNAKTFANKIEQELSTLGMKSAKFSVNLTRLDDKQLNQIGIDEVEFYFSANAGEPQKTMSKIISGGEMSRFMLALKLVENSNDYTYIFDEIDAGISGEVANIIAQKFSVLSKKIQIITISHLAQIVSYSDASYKIEKQDDGINTTTNITHLDYDGKVLEVVRLTGGNVGETSIGHAKQLIEIATNYKNGI